MAWGFQHPHLARRQLTAAPRFPVSTPVSYSTYFNYLSLSSEFEALNMADSVSDVTADQLDGDAMAEDQTAEDQQEDNERDGSLRAPMAPKPQPSDDLAADLYAQGYARYKMQQQTGGSKSLAGFA